jgi:hypothetical protein
MVPACIVQRDKTVTCVFFGHAIITKPESHILIAHLSLFFSFSFLSLFLKRYKTAKLEIDRKDAEIKRLRAASGDTPAVLPPPPPSLVAPGFG